MTGPENRCTFQVSSEIPWDGYLTSSGLYNISGLIGRKKPLLQPNKSMPELCNPHWLLNLSSSLYLT
jgi:hypothetical protein